MKLAMTYANHGPWAARPGERRVLKQLVRRARRRTEKVKLEDTPKRFTKGWL